MKKGLLIGAIVIVLGIALVGAYYALKGSSGIPSYTPPVTEPPGQGVSGAVTSDTDPFEATITYTDKGFSPADITVTQGTRVRFVNDSRATFWPASGVHPTHT